MVEERLSSSSEKERALGLDLVDAGLRTWDFESYYGFEFGARRRDYGWHPTSQTEAKAWFRIWIDMVAAIGRQDNADGRRARSILGEAWPRFWGRLGLDDELSAIARCLSTVDGWPEGWLGVRRVLQRGAKSLPPGSFAQLRDLEKILAPSDLLSEIRSRVLVRGAFAYDFDDEGAFDGNDSEPLSPSEKSRRAWTKAESLGARAASSPGLIETLVPDLCSAGLTNRAIAFGWGIGRHHTDLNGLLVAVRTHMQRSDSTDLSLIWVWGLLTGWRAADPDAVEIFLDDAVDDVVWQVWFVELQVRSELDARAVNRLLKVLDQGRCPTEQFSYLAVGSATDTLTVQQIMALSNKVASRPDRGLPIAIELLGMVVHSADTKDDPYRLELGEALLEFLGVINWSRLKDDHGQKEHFLGMISEFAVRSAESEDSVTPILTSILKRDAADQESQCDPRRVALKPFFQFFPRLALDMVCVPGEDGGFRRATSLISDPHSEGRETSVGLVPKETLCDWCNAEPATRFAFAARACTVFEKQDGKTVPVTLSATALELFASAPDQSVVLEEFIGRFYPWGSSGSRADILESRLPLLDQLATRGYEAVRSRIDTARANLQKSIDEERAYEAAQERTSDASFE